jgi:lipopolysaccharide export LptBFGC system permease protein LptF
MTKKKGVNMENKQIKLVVNNEDKKNKFKSSWWYDVAWFSMPVLFILCMLSFYVGKVSGNQTMGLISVITWCLFLLAAVIVELE